MTDPPSAAAVGKIAAEHLTPILYALEVCAVAMDEAGRGEEARYYRSLARELAGAAGPEREKSPKP